MLSDRELEVTQGILWEGKTERCLGREMNISKTMVGIYKERAMKKNKINLLHAQKEAQRPKKRVED